jgi:hypothetical protein
MSGERVQASHRPACREGSADCFDSVGSADCFDIVRPRYTGAQILRSPGRILRCGSDCTELCLRVGGPTRRAGSLRGGQRVIVREARVAVLYSPVTDTAGTRARTT